VPRFLTVSNEKDRYGFKFCISLEQELSSTNENNANIDLFDENPEPETTVEEEETKKTNIYFTTPNRKIQDLVSDWKRGNLDPRPTFQRGYVWDRTKASRLVESVLLRVPIPAVYTAEETDGSEIVIDGQQRLLSLFSFYDGIFPKKNSKGEQETFKLTGLRVLKDLNGTSFKEWQKPQQREFLNYPIPLTTITKDSDPEVRFEIFERLNSGAQTLNDQELRNCVYRGNYNDLIRDLASSSDFQDLLSFPKLQERMLDAELVLRFFAFQNTQYLKYKGSMKQFLNSEMTKNRKITDAQKKELEKAFNKSVELTKLVFGKRAFRRLVLGKESSKTSTWEERKLNRGLFDIIMLGFSLPLYEKRDVVPLADAIREEMLWLETTNDKFIDALSGSGTDRKDKIQLKFDTWLSSLKQILGYSSGEPRNFSAELKERLWKANPYCAIETCNQKILDTDDAEVDHIEFYWRGGKTIPENARLVHRYCNRKRGGGPRVIGNPTAGVQIIELDEPPVLAGEEDPGVLSVEEANSISRHIFDNLRTSILDLGPDVSEKQVRHWQALMKGERAFVYMQTRKIKPEVRCRVFGFAPPLQNPKNIRINIWRNSNNVEELVMYLKERDIEAAMEIITRCYLNLA
jgi:hypothetical protein